MKHARFRVEHDFDFDLSWLCESEEEYEHDPVIVGGRELSWEEYQSSYGDPANYESFFVFYERECDCCGSWYVVDACGGFDQYIYDHGDKQLSEGIFYKAESMPAHVLWNFGVNLEGGDDETTGN